MKYIIEYYYLNSDHILALPEFDHNEYVDVESLKILEEHIKKKKDPFGNYFVKGKLMGFSFVSIQGGIKIKKLKIKKIK